MREKQLTEKQLQLIELIAEGQMTIKDICDVCNVPRRTYYEWRKLDHFKKALSEMLEEKKQVAYEMLKGRVHDYIDTYEDLRKNSKNPMVRYHANRELISLAGMIVPKVQEVTVNKDSEEDKNELLDMLKSEE